MNARSFCRFSLLSALSVLACSPTAGTGASVQGTVKLPATHTSTPPKTTATKTPATAATGDGGGETETPPPQASPLATATPTASPSSAATASPAATPSASATPAASPTAAPAGALYTRQPLPAFFLETDSTSQMTLFTATAGQVLLVPDGKDILIVTATGTAVPAIDLSTALGGGVAAGVQALAVSGNKVYALGLLAAIPSLFTLTLDPATLKATATSLPLQGTVKTRTIGGLVLKDANTLLAADTNNSVLDAVAIADGTVTNFAGTFAQVGTATGTPAAVHFDHPTALALSDLTLYVMDAGNNRILMGDLGSNSFTTLLGGTAGSADGPFASAQLSGSEGLFMDGKQLDIADTANGSVRIANLTSLQVSTVSTGTAVQGGLVPFARGVGALNGTLYASDGSGDLYSFKPK